MSVSLNAVIFKASLVFMAFISVLKRANFINYWSGSGHIYHFEGTCSQEDPTLIYWTKTIVIALYT